MKHVILFSTALIASSIAAPALGPPVTNGPLNPSLSFNLMIGTTRQNVGELKGHAIYERVYNALREMCPGGIQGSATTFERCGEKVTRPTTRCELGNLHYIDKQENHQSKGKMGVWVEKSHWVNEGMRDVMIQAIANTVETQVADEKNCYTHGCNPYPICKVKFCNIGDAIEVKLDGTENYMKVHFDFATDKGPLDCFAIKEASANKLDPLVQEMADTLDGIPIGKAVECSTEGVKLQDANSIHRNDDIEW